MDNNEFPILIGLLKELTRLLGRKPKETKLRFRGLLNSTSKTFDSPPEIHPGYAGDLPGEGGGDGEYYDG